MPLQLQQFLDDTHYRDLSQSGFRSGFRTEKGLVALVEDLRKDLDRLILLDLSVVFDTIIHSILLEDLLGVAARCYNGSAPLPL